MGGALADWEAFLHEKDPALPVLVRCALLHHQFETIHPFLDGNGRLGRLLISFFLAQQGVLAQPLLYVSPYLEKRCSEYYERLQNVRRNGDFDGWIGFFLDAVTSQAQDSVRRAEALLAVSSSFRERLRRARARGSAVELADQLIANPYLTTTRAVKDLEMTYQGAAYAIQRLVDAGGSSKRRSRRVRRSCT